MRREETREPHPLVDAPVYPDSFSPTTATTTRAPRSSSSSSSSSPADQAVAQNKPPRPEHKLTVPADWSSGPGVAAKPERTPVSQATPQPTAAGHPAAVPQWMYPGSTALKCLFPRRGPRQLVFVAGVKAGVPGDWSSSLGSKPGSPATGLRRRGESRGESKMRLSQNPEGHGNCGTALSAPPVHREPGS
jgi:hypothetical protein